MDIRYPIGGGAPLKFAGPAKPKAEPVTIIALCDGSAVGFAGTPNLDTVRAQNALAADRLVERIAKRVTEMQGATVIKFDGQLSPEVYAKLKTDWARDFGEMQASYAKSFG